MKVRNFVLALSFSRSHHPRPPMPIQTDNLVMAALGVVKDKPPNKIQPPLEDGIHLRFAFAPERGFPWYGYYLFRRLREPSTPRCLQAKFNRDWRPGPWAGTQADFPGGVFSSDANLVFLDQFPPVASPEFDLRHRQYLRFELPAKERAREFHVKLGVLGDAPLPTQRCVLFTEVKPGLYPNPYISANVAFTSLTGDGLNRNCEIRLSKDTAGLVCLDQVIVRLPVSASSIEVELFQTASTADVIAIDAGGAVIAQKSAPALEGRQTIQLSGGAIAYVKIVALKGTLVLRFCYATDTTATGATAATRKSQAPPLLGPIKLRGFDGPVRVAETAIFWPAAGSIVTAVLAADTMTALEIEGGPAALIDICTVAISDDLARGWIPLVKQPICLPVELKDYPCPGKPATLAKARSLAQSRIHYGTASTWVGKTFTELNTLLKDLVVGGPAGGAMVKRTKSYPASAPDAPALPELRLLDVVLVASLHPANAMMLGLYWIDSTAQVGTAYDYMVMADHGGRFHGDPKAALAALAAALEQGLPADVDVWVTFGKKREAAPPLAPPAAPTVYALPGATTGANAPASNVPLKGDARNMAGLDWQIDAAPDGSLLPEGPVGYHLWRAALKSGPPSSPPPSPAYQLLTADRLIVATEIPLPSGAVPERASDWPPFPLKAFDPGLPDGWYSYCLSAVDLFGRHSAMGPAGPWLQWAWPTPAPPALPAPKPWYYVDPPAQRQINPFAVRLLDKTPPPRVQGVEADALDPDDRMLLRDAAYTKWWAAKETAAWWKKLGADRDRVLPLRVRWKWTPVQMLQAPDTKEFRIYFHPGKNPPAPDHTDPTKWQERIYVVDYNNRKHFNLTTDVDGVQLRQYEVLLPEVVLPLPKGPKFPGVPLAPSESEEIVYAHISVSAADDKSHTDDDPKRASGGWGKRFGNEGLLGTPAKIYRVLRSKPPAPAAIDESDKVLATRADYHSRSYYTFRWRKSGLLRAHIFRTLDDTLFQVDWEQRQGGAPAISPKDPANFPIPTWTQPTRNAIAKEINGLVVPGSTGLFDDAVRKAYDALSNNALRTLAGLPRNEAAFSQITYLPLDPADPSNADRSGPDGTDAYIPNANLCAYTAELDGRARNRYFFRAAYVNAAQTVGPLGPSSPPVYLPKVEPPRTPVITKVLGGDRQITIKWASNREPDLAEYRVYRADNEKAARDFRLMELLHTEPVSAGDPLARPAELSWVNASELRLTRYYYRLCAVDGVGNRSQLSPIVVGQAYDYGPPSEPVWERSKWVKLDQAGLEHPWEEIGTTLVPAVALAFTTSQENVSALMERQDGRWHSISQWIRVAIYDETHKTWRFTLYDRTAKPITDHRYRIRLITTAGVSLVSAIERNVPMP